MRKYKIYLDTSVISHLDQPEKQSEYEYTKLFWEDVLKSRFDVFISSLVVDEINKCKREKKMKLLNFLADIEYNEIVIKEDF